jgi:hypothetical protein
MAWSKGDEDVDGQAGAFVLAETILILRATLIGLSKRKR